MSVSEFAIRLHGVSKCFKRYERPIDRLKELFYPGRSRANTFWALRDIDLDIPRGQTLGIVGPNGAGKSTLLQIVAGTMTPTTGSVEVNGRVSALLELGSGFNPEFTGRQNAFFNGRLLGLSRAEMERKFDAIAAFADIGDFIDEPVKTYSSGMFVRLAFAVAVSVDPEILIVDEALAVGDILFQRKCFNKIEELANRGVTILFVSHDLNSVLNLCDRAIVIDDRTVYCDDKPHPAVLAYSTLMAQREAEQAGATFQHQLLSTVGVSGVRASRIGSGDAEVLSVDVVDGAGRATQTVRCGERVTVRVTIRYYRDVPAPISGFKLKTLNGIAAIGHSTLGAPKCLPPVAAGSTVMVEFGWPCYLTPGSYTLTVGASEMLPDGKIVPLDRRRDVLPLSVVGATHSYGLLAAPVDVDFTFAERAAIARSLA